MIFEDLKNEIAEKAINGDRDAQLQMLKCYEGYINKVSTITVQDKFGNLRKYVDEDLKSEVQMRYLIELSKCEVK